MNKLIACTLAASVFLVGCSSNKATKQTIESPETQAQNIQEINTQEQDIRQNTGFMNISENCPKIYIGEKPQDPDGAYNLTFLADTEVKSYTQRLNDLQDSIYRIESKYPEKKSINPAMRNYIFNTTNTEQTSKEVITDLLTVSYIQHTQSEGLNYYDMCNYSKQAATVNYLKNVFNYDQLLLIDSLLTTKDIRKTDLSK